MVFYGDRGKEAVAYASVVVPISTPPPASLVFLVFVGLCADLGVRNAVAAFGLLDRILTCEVILPVTALT